jgi:CHAT domain-containing protein
LLYRARFSEGLDSATSAWQASRQLLESRRAQRQSTNPFFWAGFVAAGDWR